jgi:hypothetical protein
MSGEVGPILLSRERFALAPKAVRSRNPFGLERLFGHSWPTVPFSYLVALVLAVLGLFAGDVAGRRRQGAVNSAGCVVRWLGAAIGCHVTYWRLWRCYRVRICPPAEREL